jgi:hypothetical protein
METVQINREHENGILDMINKHPIFSFNDIFVYYKACSRATAYNHHLDKLDTIKEAIYSNKRQGVQTLLSKWLKSENATLQLAAMRMVCDSDEHRKLNQNYTDVTSQNEKINTVDPFALMRENHAINSETKEST